MPSVWKRWFAKPPEEPVVVERMAPVEVTPITEVKRYLARGDVASAVRFGFPRALEDATRAYRLPSRPDLTDLEFIRSTMVPGSPLAGQLELFERAYRVYEPVRFGALAARSDDFLSTLTSIYAAPEMQRLYASTAKVPAPSAVSAFPGDF